MFLLCMADGGRLSVSTNTNSPDALHPPPPGNPPQHPLPPPALRHRQDTSCRQLRDLAQDRTIWSSLLAQQRLLYPIPPWLAFSGTHPAADIEHAVVSTHRIAQAWSRPRIAPLRVKPPMPATLLVLEMFLDRWLLVVYAGGLAHLWDTKSDSVGAHAHLNSNPRYTVCAELEVNAENNNQPIWSSCAVQVSDDDSKLIVLLNGGSRPTYCCVYEVALRCNASFELTGKVRISTQGIVRTASLADNILVLSRGSNINLVDISENPRRDLLVISSFSEELEDMWNGTIEIRIFHRYMFAFKAHSIEVYNMNDLLASTEKKFSPIPISKDFFQRITFRDVKYSTPTITFDDAQLEIKFQAFANDVLTGLFHYEIHFSRRETNPPIFNVTLLNIYPLAEHVVTQFHTHWVPSGPEFFTPSPTPTNDYGNAFRTNLSAKGFLTAFTIGPNAKRAVWVERVRGSTVREIHVWENSRAPDNQDLPGEIESLAVYTIASLDLREDVTRCALSESTGLIVWGNRAGDIFLLDVDA